MLAALLLGLAAGFSADTTCEVAVVGGGWAGIYFGYRMVHAGKRVCIFERSERIGGRTFSVNVTTPTRKEVCRVDLCIGHNGKSVLGCIEADFCYRRLAMEHFSRSRR